LPSVNEHPGVLLYSRIKKSPYYYASRKHGVQLYSTYNHHYHPRHYGDPVEEYWHLLNGVTLWDVGGAERQIEISGPDAFDFTQLLVARDLNKCAVEQCKYVFLCLPDGGIINDPVLLRVEENRFWLSLADSDVELWARGVAYNAGMDVTVKEIDVGPLQVQGPKSKDVMLDLFGESVLEIPYYYMRPFEVNGMNVLVSRTGYTSELGFEIYLYEASKNGVKMWETVLEAGRPHGLEVIGPCHIRRIEGGILALGCDMWFDTNPYEVGMGYDWMVDLQSDADFIGKEALAKIRQEGAKRLLVGVEIEGSGMGSYNDGAFPDELAVHSGGGRVGEITSACWSPKLEKNIGFAMVPTELGTIGTELQIERDEGMVGAIVVEKPFVDPEKEIPQQELTASES
jgi:glycine cleavage system aminomethyltransferase T